MRSGYMQQQHNGRCYEGSAASAAEELESSVLVTCMNFYIGGNYSECLVGYIKLLTSTNKYYMLGCCGSCVPTLSRLSKVFQVERQSQSRSLMRFIRAFRLSILVAPSVPYFVLHLIHLGVSSDVFWCFLLMTTSTSHFTGFFFLMP